MMEPVYANEDKLLSTESDYFIYEVFYTNLMVTTKENLKTQNI